MPKNQATQSYRRVLVVDDNPAIVAAISTRLYLSGWDCMTALNGHDAMCLLNQRDADAVITDLDMPYVDGYGILEVAETFIGRPAIAITGSRESAARCARDFPGTPLLLKPFEASELLELLESSCPPHNAADAA
ncbi:MAG: response regulator [Phycisphaeraceae bacterium]|nr:response regulator [Phycisphaeraceae bacterium]